MQNLSECLTTKGKSVNLLRSGTKPFTIFLSVKNIDLRHYCKSLQWAILCQHNIEVTCIEGIYRIKVMSSKKTPLVIENETFSQTITCNCT